MLSEEAVQRPQGLPPIWKEYNIRKAGVDVVCYTAMQSGINKGETRRKLIGTGKQEERTV